jgi:hypothetical protein
VGLCRDALQSLDLAVAQLGPEDRERILHAYEDTQRLLEPPLPPLRVRSLTTYQPDAGRHGGPDGRISYARVS